jgi:hypothetical protein
MSFREIAVIVALIIPLAGLVIEYFRTRARVHDFSDISKEIKNLMAGLDGELDRDGGDLLVRGSYGNWPVLVRFSRSEDEAGVSIEMPVPTNLTLYCYPVSHEGEEGQVLLRTSDEQFMSHFRLSTNNSPLEVSMIISSPAVLAELSKITDSQTYLILENRMLELVERTIIPGNLGARLLNCVRGMARITSEATGAHGNAGPMAHPPKRERNWFRLGYFSVSALILIVLLVEPVLKRPSRGATAKPLPPPVSTIPAALATQVPQLQGWHVADTGDFDPDADAWMQQQGQRCSGQISANVESAQSQDLAYIFRRPQGPLGTNSARFVLFINNQKRYDAEMPRIDAAGRISKSRIGSVEWRGRGPNSEPNADGIILIQRYDDPTSAIVFFMSGPKLLTAVPKDFRNVTLD